MNIYLVLLFMIIGLIMTAESSRWAEMYESDGAFEKGVKIVIWMSPMLFVMLLIVFYDFVDENIINRKQKEAFE